MEQNNILNHQQQNIYDLLTHNIEEVIDEKELKEKIKHKKILNIYWGTACTKPPSFAYLFPLIKVRDFTRAQQNVTILLADVHSYMDLGAEKRQFVEERTDLYKLMLVAMMKMIGVDTEYVSFVEGSSYQLDQTYCRELYQLAACTHIKTALKASAEVVKGTKNHKSDSPDALISHLLYPLMQCLDESVLQADVELGGRDQRKIFMFSRDNIEKIGHEKCNYLITPLIPSLKGKGHKMSSSDTNGKIGFMDTDIEIASKIKSAFCMDKNDDTDINPLVAIVKFIIFPLNITLNEQDSWMKWHSKWMNGEITSQDLKKDLIECVITLVNPIRQVVERNMSLYQSACL